MFDVREDLVRYLGQIALESVFDGDRMNNDLPATVLGAALGGRPSDERDPVQ